MTRKVLLRLLAVCVDVKINELGIYERRNWWRTSKQKGKHG